MASALSRALRYAPPRRRRGFAAVAWSGGGSALAAAFAMLSEAYSPVAPGLWPEESFLSLGDILMTHERLPCRAEIALPRLGAVLGKAGPSRPAVAASAASASASASCPDGGDDDDANSIPEVTPRGCGKNYDSQQPLVHP